MKTSPLSWPCLPALAIAALTLQVRAQDPEPDGSVAADLKVRLMDEGIRIDWNTDGILEAAPDLRGPWKEARTTNGASFGTAKAADVPVDSQARFFRVRERDGTLSQIVPLIPDLPARPPVFDDVTLGAFDGHGVDVKARLKEGETAPPVIPFFVDEKVVILRDDGKNGDDVAGDRVFEGVVPLDLDELNRAKAFLSGLPQGVPVAVPTFDGRSQDTQPVGTVAETSTRLDDLLAGKPVKFPFDFGVPPTVIPKPPGGGTPTVPGLTPCNQLPTWQKCLLINDLTVVEDPTRTFDPCTGVGTPMGAWTFGKLMTDMANTPVSGISPSDFARRWLRSWEVNQTINNDPVPNRQAGMAATILQSWQNASGGPNRPLDMAKAPFRLLSIVNRIDLRGNFTYGGTGPIGDPCDPPCNSGEGRFVFCFCDPRSDQGGGYGSGGGTGVGGNPAGGNDGGAAGGGEFLVIFEYCIPKHSCSELHAYAQEWANLQCIPFGPAYNAALQAITDQFAKANAAPGRANNSALNQLRTNENLLDPLWELREFKIFKNDTDAGHLRPVTVKQTPREDSDATALLQNYITTTLPAPPAHTVPLEWSLVPGGASQPFLGGRAVMAPISVTSGSPAWATTGATVPNMVRHDFALNTCNGCHSTETSTRFVHVGCRIPGQPAPLSGFLVGDGSGGPFLVNIPGSPAATVGFNDLQRREKDLINFLLTPCGLQVFSTGLQAVH